MSRVKPKKEKKKKKKKKKERERIFILLDISQETYNLGGGEQAFSRDFCSGIKVGLDTTEVCLILGDHSVDSEGPGCPHCPAHHVQAPEAVDQSGRPSCMLQG